MSLPNQFCKYCGAKLPEGDDANKLCPQCNRINVFSSPVANGPATRNISVLPKSFGMILVAICVLGVILMGAMTKYHAARYISLSQKIAELREKDAPPQALIEEMKESRDNAAEAYLGSAFWKTLIMIACFIAGFVGAVLMMRSQDTGERKMGFAALLVLLIAAGYFMSPDMNYFGSFLHYMR